LAILGALAKAGQMNRFELKSTLNKSYSRIHESTRWLQHGGAIEIEGKPKIKHGKLPTAIFKLTQLGLLIAIDYWYQSSYELWSDDQLKSVTGNHKEILPEFLKKWDTLERLGVKEIAKKRLSRCLNLADILQPNSGEIIDERFWRLEPSDEDESKWISAMSREPTLRVQYLKELRKAIKASEKETKTLTELLVVLRSD